MKTTYFLDSKFFISIANIAFNIIFVQDLVSDLTGIPPSQILFVEMIALTASAIGFASYLLQRNATGSRLLELREFLADPPRAFLAYLTIVIAWAVSGTLFQPWKLESGLNLNESFQFTYEPWFLLASLILLAAFIGLPVRGVFERSRNLSDLKASRSLKIVSLSWAGFGAVTFFQLLPATAPTFSQVGFIAESLLFVMIAFALKEPTVISRIMATPSTQTVTGSGLIGGDIIVRYDMESDRRKLIESFAREELKAGRKAVCFVVKSDTPFYTAVLKGIVGSTISVGERVVVSVRPLESMLLENTGNITSASAIPQSELIDLGDLDLQEARPFLERAKPDANGQSPGRRRIWAINAEGAEPALIGMIRALSPQARTIDQVAQQDSFSSWFGAKHKDILGTRFLLEFEPSSRYEDLVEKFVAEFQANVEPAAIFTSVGSPIHKRVHGERDLRLFSFSGKTSTPSRGMGEEVYLPERDSSLLLDAVDKMLQTCHGQHPALAFDIFSDLILLQGFDKAYGVLSSVVEMTESEQSTVLVLLNYSALDEKILNGVRGLFTSRIVCDSNGVRLIGFLGDSHRSYANEKPSYDETIFQGVRGR